MSIIFSAGKKSVQKLRPNNAGMPSIKKDISKKYQVGDGSSYVPNDGIDVWNYTLDGKFISLAFCKDTFDVWYKDELIECMESQTESETLLTFEITSHKCRITLTAGDKPDTIKSVLSIDGKTISPYLGSGSSGDAATASPPPATSSSSLSGGHKSSVGGGGGAPATHRKSTPRQESSSLAREPTKINMKSFVGSNLASIVMNASKTGSPENSLSNSTAKNN